MPSGTTYDIFHMNFCKHSHLITESLCRCHAYWI